MRREGGEGSTLLSSVQWSRGGGRGPVPAVPEAPVPAPAVPVPAMPAAVSDASSSSSREERERREEREEEREEVVEWVENGGKCACAGGGKCGKQERDTGGNQGTCNKLKCAVVCHPPSTTSPSDALPCRQASDSRVVGERRREEGNDLLSWSHRHTVTWHGHRASLRYS